MADESNKNILKKWEVLKGVDDEQLEEIKFFHAFQAYTRDDEQRMASAMFITTNDDVFTIGHNNEDNLLALTGDQFAKPVVLNKPKKIDKLSGKSIRKIVVSERFGAALTEDGRLLYWGTAMRELQYNVHGIKYVKEPHEPRENFKISDMACGAHCITFVTDQNQVLIWGCINLYYSRFYTFEKVPLRPEVQVKALASGWYHTALLDHNGHVWTFGYGSVGQLGQGSNWQLNDETTPGKVTLPEPCLKVECGAYSTIFLLNNGDVFACGSNSQSDHLCVGKTGHVIVPSKVLLNDNILDIAATYAWSSSGIWQSLFSAVSKDDEKYFKWGDETKLDSPEMSEDAHSFLDIFANFKTPQSLGELVRVDVIPLQLQGSGIGQISPDPLPDRSILSRWSIFDELDEDFKRNISFFTVFGGSLKNNHVFGAFVKTRKDDVYSWGLNIARNGVTKSPAIVENLSGKNIKKILISVSQGVGLSEDGSLYVWNTMTPPELENHLKGKTVIDVSCGSRFFVYNLADDSVYINGTISAYFSEVTHQRISIPNNEKVVALASGAWHFLVLTHASNVYAFGDGTYGQLGTNWEQDKNSPFTGTKVNLPGPCKKIMCGTSSSFFLTDKGELYACGSNNADPLGVGHSKIVYKPEKVVINEKVEDIAGAIRFNSYGGQISSFALKTISGKIYKWEEEDDMPKELKGARFLIEAFEERETPQSLSLVHLSSIKSDEANELDLNLGGHDQLATSYELKLYGDPLYSDVTIILKDGEIPGHKALLHLKSAFFRKALSSRETTNRDKIDLVSYNPKAVRALLKHIYGVPLGTPAITVEDAFDFLRLAVEDGDQVLLSNAQQIVLKNMVIKMFNLLTETNIGLSF